MFDQNNTGQKMYDLLKELFPYCRSLTGTGVQETLSVLKKNIPLQYTYVPSGKKCFDWEVPDEWQISSAFIKDTAGRKIVDFSENNLHLMSYSVPVCDWFTLEELMPHIFTLPNKPNAIPYLTSYYQKRWGFCMRHNDFLKMKDEKYYVEINSTLKPGNLILAEAYLPGETDKEILFSCYYCHPSMANDCLSGVVTTAQLYQEISREKRRYSYRFLFIPETIGAISYLSLNQLTIKERVHAGFVVTCCGDPGKFNYKKTRHGNHEIDRLSENILKFSDHPYQIRNFWPGGSDERQYSSPGFNLPMGLLMRSVYTEYPQYHTSEDDLNFITAQALGETLELYYKIVMGMEGNRRYQNQNPFCEPQMSKRGLYPSLGVQKDHEDDIRRRMWVLNYSDGHHDLLSIAEKMTVSILDLIETARLLENVGLLKEQE